jgi:hypothetical protein
VRGARADVDAFVTGRLCADVAGFNLQAATRIAANERAGLERIARYLARPPIATDRLSRLDDGRLELQLKRPWRDGTTAFVLTPHELIERLVTLVPRPRAHLTRYFGVFAPAFAARAAIVPAGVTKTARACAGAAGADDPATAPVSRRRFPWASLIWRVFLKDVLECVRCKGRMQIVAALTSRVSIERVLEHLGLALDAPEFHPARPPPQTELSFGDEPAVVYPDPPAPDDFAA